MLATVADALLSDLRSIVGTEHVLDEPDRRAGYETDWTGRYRGDAVAVVRPGSTDDVADVVRTCAGHGASVVTQGGNTGLVGGGVPRREGGDRRTVVVTTRRLDDLGEVDVSSQQVTAGAGVTLEAWRAHANRAGLDTPVDFAARGSATIGGAIATNAGGSRVLRFGTMRQQVTGIEAVLADGRVVGSLAGLPKEAAGLHWPSILAGSEGTLGVLTRARLRLVPSFEHRCSALVGLGSVAEAVDLLAELRGLASLDAAEVMAAPAVELVSRRLGTGPPVPVGCCAVLVDCADHHDPTDELASVLARTGASTGAAVATDPRRRGDLLRYRDELTGSIAQEATELGSPTFKLDVAVPVGKLESLLAVAQGAADDDGARLIAFGHLAEGNLHLNYLAATDTERIADVVLGATAGLGGTISAEHGIGVAKSRWLPLIRSDGDLAAQRAIKDALDPDGVLNPGVLGT